METGSIFKGVEVVTENGKKKQAFVFYGTVRGSTTWFVICYKPKSTKKFYRKIEKNKEGEFIFKGINEDGIDERGKIADNVMIDIISKDY